MINQSEASLYEEEALPETSADLDPAMKNDVYKRMSALTLFMHKNITAHNYKVVKRCLKIADKLWDKGNDMVKNAVWYAPARQYGNC